MSADEHKALVRRFEEEAWNRRNPPVVDALFAPDYVAHLPGVPPLDRAGHRDFIAAFQVAFPDGRSTTEDLLAEGDRVAWRWTFRGTQRGEFQEIPPTGKAGGRRPGGGELAQRRHPGAAATAGCDPRAGTGGGRSQSYQQQWWPASPVGEEGGVQCAPG